MDELRGVLEQLAQAVCNGLEKSLGRGVEIGLHGRWDDHEVNKRHLPLRAALVKLRYPLDDCIVGVSSMREDVLKSAITAAMMAIAESLGCEPEVMGAPELHEYDDREHALEQLDALYTEPTLHFTTPKGDLLIVIGSGLPPAVRAILRGDVDPTGNAVASGGHPDVDAMADALLGGADAAMPVQSDTSDVPTPELPMAHFGGAGGGTEEVVYTDHGPVPISQLTAEQAAAAGVTLPAGHPALGQAAPGGVAPAIFPSFNNAYADTAAQNALAAAPDMEQLLSGVEVELSAELGRTSMRLGDITALAENSVFSLDQMVDEPVRVYVNGALFGTARLVVVNDEYGIEMLEVFDQGEVQTEHPLAA
jgi:flagellar motor switch protein FliN